MTKADELRERIASIAARLTECNNWPDVLWLTAHRVKMQARRIALLSEELERLEALQTRAAA